MNVGEEVTGPIVVVACRLLTRFGFFGESGLMSRLAGATELTELTGLAVNTSEVEVDTIAIIDTIVVGKVSVTTLVCVV